jgi:hypothetical protein
MLLCEKNICVKFLFWYFWDNWNWRKKIKIFHERKSLMILCFHFAPLNFKFLLIISFLNSSFSSFCFLFPMQHSRQFVTSWNFIFISTLHSHPHMTKQSDKDEFSTTSEAIFPLLFLFTWMFVVLMETNQQWHFIKLSVNFYSHEMRFLFSFHFNRIWSKRITEILLS